MTDWTAFLFSFAPRVRGQKAADQAAIINAIGPVFGQYLAEYEINTLLRQAHFLAQVAHECDGFCTTQEYASGKGYEGRRDLGNTEPGDGPRYKGHGLIQLTGRFNHRLYGKLLGLPLEAEPWRAAEPVISLRIACEYWRQKGLNAFADANDIETITRRINGGLHGYADRQRYLAKAKTLLAAAPPTVPLPTPKPQMPTGQKTGIIAAFFGWLAAAWAFVLDRPLLFGLGTVALILLITVIVKKFKGKGAE